MRVTSSTWTALGTSANTYFFDRVLPLLALPLVATILAIAGAVDWTRKSWPRITEMLFTVLYFISIVAWIVGCAIPNSTVLAIGLGSFGGITISAQTTKTARGQALFFCIITAVTAVLWLFRRFTLQPHEPLIGAVSLIVALYVSKPEYTKGEKP